MQRIAQPIVVLISGRGSNMRALIERSRDAGAAFTVSCVISDQPQAAGLGIAGGLGIPTTVVAAAQGAQRGAYDDTLARAIEPHSPALIVLAGFMRILSGGFVDRYAGRIVNIHPSLLPAYPGLHTHRRALAAGATEHGATVHFVTEQLDGGPAIIQARTTVAADDDEASLAARVQTLEHRIYPLAVRWYCEGRLRCHEGDAWLDGNALAGPVQYGDIVPAGATHAA